VLPSIHTSVVEATPNLAGGEVSGTNLLLQPVAGGDVQSRVFVEATKLREIAEEVGVVFHECDEQILDRLVDMEGRDAGEKEGWAMNRGNQGFQ
jgi:energy-coupling factor transporter ATP-binding protein EcfA2